MDHSGIQQLNQWSEEGKTCWCWGGGLLKVALWDKSGKKMDWLSWGRTA